MQIDFNSLQKPNQMSEQKCRAAFLTDNKWSSYILSTFDLVRKCRFCAFNGSMDNSQVGISF